MDMFSYSLLLVPLHLGVHWCLAVVDMEKLEIEYYDSLGNSNTPHAPQALMSYLKMEHMDKKQRLLSTFIGRDIPKQNNYSDCGMFICKFAEYRSRMSSFTFNSDHMPYYRRRMIFEIVNKTLMCP